MDQVWHDWVQSQDMMLTNPTVEKGGNKLYFLIERRFSKVAANINQLNMFFPHKINTIQIHVKQAHFDA